MVTGPSGSWERDRVRLEHSLYVFLVVWIGGALVAVVGGFIESKAVFWVGAILFLLSLIPYVVTLVNSYRLQDKVTHAQGKRSAAWVVVGGLILNPFILGVIIPALVLRSERNARARLNGSVGHSA